MSPVPSRIVDGFLTFPVDAAPPRDAILCGDCRALLAELPAGCIDFVLTDPPYAVRYRDRLGRRIANDDNASWMPAAFAEIARVMRPDSLMLCCYGWNAVDSFMAAWRGAGLRPVGHLTLAKSYASSRAFFNHCHEQAFLLAKGRPSYPQFRLPDVLPFPYTGNRLHPTEKPLAVLGPLVEAFTAPGDLVLDPFCGSGSSLFAAKRAGRHWLGVEIDAGHHATATARLAGP